jgi:mono/diheme cytochrome c family protein
MPKALIGLIAVLLMLGLLPFALIARSRAVRNGNLAVHMVFDMDKQPKFIAQRPAVMFADGRSMRPQVAGTVAREDLELRSETLDDAANPRPVDGQVTEMRMDSPEAYAAVMLGRVRSKAMTDAEFAALHPPADDKAMANDATFYVRTIPVQIAVTKDFLRRGQERFTIYCSPCHGLAGYGDGMVQQRALALQSAGSPEAAGWVAPQNLQEQKIHARPDGSLFNTISNGVRSMPPYDKQISILDRWAIVAYVRALQRSQDAPLDDLPAAIRAQYK